MNRLKQLRTEKGSSLREVAALIGTSNQNLSNWERDEREGYPKLSLNIWKALAQNFGVSVEYLQGLSDYRTEKEHYKAVRKEFIQADAETFDENNTNGEFRKKLPDEVKSDLQQAQNYLKELQRDLVNYPSVNWPKAEKETTFTSIESVEFQTVQEVFHLITSLHSVITNIEGWKSSADTAVSINGGKHSIDKQEQLQETLRKIQSSLKQLDSDLSDL